MKALLRVRNVAGVLNHYCDSLLIIININFYNLKKKLIFLKKTKFDRVSGGEGVKQFARKGRHSSRVLFPPRVAITNS